jgi:hypothetical protein
MDSKRTKDFKNLFDSLPDHIKENARKQYKLFLENQSHPSLRTKPVGSTRSNRFRVYTTHNSFDKKY